MSDEATSATETQADGDDGRAKTSPENGKKGGRPPAVKDISDTYISSLGRPFPMKKHRGQWYRFDGKIYRPFSSDDLKSSIMAFLRARRPNFATGSMVGNVIDNLIDSTVAGVESRFQVPCWLPEGNPAGGWISMANTVLNVNEFSKSVGGLPSDLSKMVCPHTPNLFSTFSLGYDWNPAAPCAKWEAYLEGVQPDPQMREILQMMAGLCLVPDTSFEVFFVLYGEGGCGKSVFLNVLEAVVGPVNVCTLPLSKFGEKHSAHLLTESLLNIVGDLPTNDGKTSLHAIEGILKDTVSGGLISCERKNQEPYKAHAVSRCLFATNSLPTFSDRSNGIWDRIRVVPFDVRFRGTERQNPYLTAEIIAEELPGVFVWACRGLAKLRTMRQFPRGPRGVEEENRHRENCDHEAQFIQDGYEVKNGAFTEGATIYAAYRTFCQENGYRAKNSANFGGDLRRVFPMVEQYQKKVEGTNRRGWLNLGVKFVMETEGF